ncbi:hypothetical protein [Oceanospirillum beijerinckii]|uniref:hypothetical protein n=1 Tax=Oceanospirillum beijerinckii TaxID=64976 RepID=UPI0004292D8F|nr:hypothetical protein [Oceanospirillum beijerinckii]
MSVLLTLLLGAQISGCSTYGDSVKSFLDDARQQNYSAADKVAEETLSPWGQDRLLYYLERGMIAHLDQRYKDSNQLLEQAHEIAERQYQTELQDLLITAMTHPGHATYKGQIYERVFLYYTKMLNYLMLAQEQTKGAKQNRYLDGARVENRRLQLLLDEQVLQVGGYREAYTDDEQWFKQLLDVFDQLTGEVLDMEQLIYRDQAFAHYVMGAMYEQYGELDNARISYQRAATLYEAGYREQYNLGSEIEDQAWQDTVRMMQKAGGYEQTWRRLVKEKGLRQEGYYQPGQAELLVLQHVDLSPQRQILNMHLMINKNSQRLVLRPIPLGNRKQRREQAAWFYLLYADKGLYNLVRDFYDGSILDSEGVLYNSQSTTLKPIWSTVGKSGLDQTLGEPGIRVAIPYFPMPGQPIKKSELIVSPSSRDIQHLESNQKQTQAQSLALMPADSVAMLGLLQQVVEARRDLYAAMARETLRNRTAQEALKDLGKWARLGSKLLTASTTNADTRSWLLLPHHIRLQRIQLPPGEYKVSLHTEWSETGDAGSRAGLPVEQIYTVKLVADELTILNVRTFNPTGF